MSLFSHARPLKGRWIQTGLREKVFADNKYDNSFDAAKVLGNKILTYWAEKKAIANALVNAMARVQNPKPAKQAKKAPK